MLQLDTGDLKTLTITNLFCRQYQKVPFVDGSQLLTSRYGNFFTYEFRPFDWCLLYDHLTSFFQGTCPSHSGLVLQTNRSLVNQTYLYNICLREGNFNTNEGDVLDCFFGCFPFGINHFSVIPLWISGCFAPKRVGTINVRQVERVLQGNAA